MPQSEPAVKSKRVEFIDALRALALLGVFVVNVYAFYCDNWFPTAMPQPNHSPLAWAVSGIVAALFVSKAYPLLAFVFGYGIGISARTTRGTRQDATPRRMLRLLLLGMAHGLLLYYGDILTYYALAGLVLLQLRHARLAVLLTWLKIFLVFWLMFQLLWVLGSEAPKVTELDKLSLDLLDATHWLDVWEAHASSYLHGIPSALMGYQLDVLIFVTVGIIAARLRFLEHPRFAPRWRAMMVWGLSIGLPLNLFYGIVHAWLASQGIYGAAAAHSALVVIGPVLTIGITGACATLWHTRRASLLHWLAPAGRLTLTCYIGLSIVMNLLLSGAGLNLVPRIGSIGLLLLALALYVLAMALARAVASRGKRGPFEAILRG